MNTQNPPDGRAAPAPNQAFVEGVRIRLEPAPVVRRAVALSIDVGVLTVAYYGAFLVAAFCVGLLGVGAAKAGGVGGLAMGGAILVLIAAVVIAVIAGSHFYFIYFESRSGATPGKKMMGLRVVSATGGPITLGQAAYREFARYVDWLVLPALIGMALTERRQRVGDLLAGTFVSYSRARDESDSYLYVGREDYMALYSHLAPTEVPADVAEDYLKFAYQAFALGRGVQMGAEASRWLPVVRARLARADELGLNDQTVLRFFAELCFQQERVRATGARKD